MASEEWNEFSFFCSSLTEDIHNVKNCYEEDAPKIYPGIQQKLQNCCQQVDHLLTLEGNYDSYLVLCQQKNQLCKLSQILQTVVQKTAAAENANLPTSSTYLNNETNSNFHKNEDFLAASLEVPKVKGLNDIIGLQEVKKILKSLVLLPMTQPQLFYNRPVCNTILLFGPPGTGKTRLVHALAAETGVKLHCITAGDVLSRYVGQTEKTIKKIFQSLKHCEEYSILFIDEVDALCRKRTENEQEHTRRVKTELMCQMTSIESCKNMIIICATNCPWDLDSAILRRFQKRIYVPLPTEIERFEFFQTLTKNIYFEDCLQDMDMLVQRTNGYSSSDLVGLIQNAMDFPLQELEDTKIWKVCDDGFFEPMIVQDDFSIKECRVICSELRDLPPVSVRARKAGMKDLVAAVENVKCTVAESAVKKYQDFCDGKN